MSQTNLSRRRFLQSVAATAAAAPFFSFDLRAAATLRHASIGAAGQALSDLNAFARHPSFDLVAVCDVDLCRVEPLQRRFPKVRVYQDWRELLQKERRNIDSINVSIPDHMHAVIALEAMKMGKPVYVQKPLCNTLRETRLLTEEARRRKLTTQMGIQVSSSRQQRYGEALVRSGIVGKIREVHTFSNKSWGDDKPLPEPVDPVPPSLDWDEWLGVGPSVPFKRGAYHPGEWRRRVGFGTGTLGDMGCHIYSPPYRALKLTSPTSVTAYGPAPSEESWATRARVKLTYPGTEYTAGSTVDMWWYDGGELPPDAIREPVGTRWPDQGSVVVGTEGMLVLPHGNTPPFALPEGKMAALPPIDIPERDHYAEFIDVVLGGGKEKCSANFDYAGPLTESVLIGNVAAHFPGETLEFDARRLTFPKKPEANQWLTRAYRGWKIKT
ncbi:MAG TPA: Gfo/Idh/MocA family oxidoreductase [Vicinamibacterales bacterium]|nr:Gfo/Idh/MocA family oxidoreductase [Vicinamibacterales bacterium]